MNTIAKILCTFFVLILLGTAHAEAEEVSNFTAVYDIGSNGVVTVSETITYDFGQALRHGIFRTLEAKHAQPATTWYKKRSVAIEEIEVLRDGKVEPFTLTKSGDVIEVKIGSASVEHSGTHVYTLTYKLNGALSYGPQGAEFYWNVTGNNWEVPIVSATTIVRDTTGTLFAGASDCYVGAEDATTRCLKNTDNPRQTIFSATVLVPSHGLTVAQELRTDTVAYLVHESIPLRTLAYLIPILWLIGLAVYVYRYRTKYRSTLPVIAQYEPYQGILPMYTGVLFDGNLDPCDITAGIVYLAEQGFIKIKKTEDKVLWLFSVTDYEITLLREDTNQLPPMLRQILVLLFRAGVLGLLGALKDGGATEVYTVGQVVRISELKHNDAYNRQLVSLMRTNVADELKKDGFIFPNVFEVLTETYSGTQLLVRSILLLMFFAGVYELNSLVAVIMALATFVLAGVAVTKRRTKKGYEARNHIKGFKLFLSVTDQERFVFHNAPEKSPELFMQYLPYAIALKVEKEWSKVFEGVTIPNPAWYDGGAATVFAVSDFASDVTAFSTAFAASSGAKSGISGSSGGGRSGGGGGGGGGGSW